MEHDGSLPHSQQHATCPYSDPKQLSPCCSDRARFFFHACVKRNSGVFLFIGAEFEIKYRFLTRTESTLEIRPDVIQVSKDRVFVTDIRFVYELYILWATALKSR